jgi:hypothetical protein
MRRVTRVDKRVRGDRGVVLVEAVFVLPVVIFVVFAIFEFGLLFAAQSTTNSATRDGVRFASANFAVSGSNQAAADSIAAAVANDLGARTNLDTPVQLLIYKADADGLPLHMGRNVVAVRQRVCLKTVDESLRVYRLGQRAEHARQHRRLPRGEPLVHHRCVWL